MVERKKENYVGSLKEELQMIHNIKYNAGNIEDGATITLMCTSFMTIVCC